ncbi:unnamed protein product, partial [Allacma fusca]
RVRLLEDRLIQYRLFKAIQNAGGKNVRTFTPLQLAVSS